MRVNEAEDLHQRVELCLMRLAGLTHGGDDAAAGGDGQIGHRAHDGARVGQGEPQIFDGDPGHDGDDQRVRPGKRGNGWRQRRKGRWLYADQQNGGRLEAIRVGLDGNTVGHGRTALADRGDLLWWQRAVQPAREHRASHRAATKDGDVARKGGQVFPARHDQASPRVSMSAAAMASLGDLPPHSTN